MWECRKKKKKLLLLRCGRKQHKKYPDHKHTRHDHVWISLWFFLFFFSLRRARPLTNCTPDRKTAGDSLTWTRSCHESAAISWRGGEVLRTTFLMLLLCFPNTQRSSLRGKKASPDASRLHVKRRNVASCERRCCSASPRALIQSLGRNLCTDMTLQLSASSARGGEYACTGDPHGNEAGEAFLKLKLNLGQGRTDRDYTTAHSPLLNSLQQEKTPFLSIHAHPHICSGEQASEETRKQFPWSLMTGDSWRTMRPALMNHPGWEWYFIFQQAVNPIRTCWMFRRLCTGHDISW